MLTRWSSRPALRIQQRQYVHRALVFTESSLHAHCMCIGLQLLYDTINNKIAVFLVTLFPDDTPPQKIKPHETNSTYIRYTKSIPGMSKVQHPKL